MERMLVRGGTVVSVDPQIGNLPIADILISDGTIIDVGPDIQVDDAQVIDAENCIVMPGFVDGHRHIWQGPMRSVCADWSIFDYVCRIRLNAASVFTADDMYAAQFQGGLEALNAGVTTVTDYCHNILTPDHAHESIRGLTDSGLRAVWNFGFNFPPSKDPYFRTLDSRVKFARQLAIRNFSSRDQLITLGVAPEEYGFWNTPERGVSQFTLARELNARLFWHANIGPHDEKNPREIAALNALGMLGDDLAAVHMHFTDEDEWQMLADTGAAVVFTPETEMQMGMMWARGDQAKRYGVTQCYGTDIVSNNSCDMFAALRLGLQATRCNILEKEGLGPFERNGVPVNCAEAVKWGTLDGAKALGLDAVTGSLTPGKQADLILLRTDSLTMAGWDQTNPEGSILLQAQSHDVDTVMVGGKIVKRHGKMLGDVSRACRLLQETSTRVTKRMRDRGGYRIDLDETLKRMVAVQSTEHGEYTF